MYYYKEIEKDGDGVRDASVTSLQKSPIEYSLSDLDTMVPDDLFAAFDDAAKEQLSHTTFCVCVPTNIPLYEKMLEAKEEQSVLIFESEIMRLQGVVKDVYVKLIRVEGAKRLLLHIIIRGRQV